MSLDKIAIVDIETTGPNSLEGDRIIQIAAIIIEEGIITARHSMLINPEIAIPPQIVQLTGITQDKVANAPTFQQVAGLWYHRLKDCFFVAHNLAFDFTFLKNYFREFGCGEFNPEGFDTVKLAKIFLPEATGFNLTDLANYLHLPFTDAHDALADAEVTAYILHEIAVRANAISFATRVDMICYLNQLSHQEAYILKNTKSFILNEEPIRISPLASLSNERVVSASDIKQADYLLELWRTHPHLVIEHKNQPFTLGQQIGLIQQLTQGNKAEYLILCHSQAQLDYVQQYLPANKTRILRTAEHYLHQRAFRELLLKVNIEQLTQLELTTVAAIIYWQSYAKDMNLSQLNSELLIINSMIRKYVRDTYRAIEHTSYRKAMQQVQRAQYLLTTMDSLSLLIENETLMERQLIVLDLGSVTQQLHELAATYFPVSEWFTKIKLMGERIRFLANNVNYEALLASGEQANEVIHQLLMQTHEIIERSVVPVTESQAVECCVSKGTPQYMQLVEHLQKVTVAVQQFNQQMEQTKQIQWVLEESDIQQIQQLSRQIQSFAHITEASTYWNLYAQLMQGQYLNVKLSKRSFRLPVQYTHWLERHKRAILWSDGSYHHLQAHGLFAQLGLTDYRYHLLPMVVNPAINIQVPFSYIELPRDSEQYVQTLATFIKEWEDELASHIVILASNKQMLVQLYRACTALEGWMVFAQGVNGSLCKVKRRAETEKRSIVIVQRHHAMKDNWSLDGVKTSIIIQSLPFLSLTSCHIQAIVGEISEPNEQVFHSFLLPKMCRDFQQLVQYIQDYFEVKHTYLFDERVYTKYYSSEFRERVQATINFEIIE